MALIQPKPPFTRSCPPIITDTAAKKIAALGGDYLALPDSNRDMLIANVRAAREGSKPTVAPVKEHNIILKKEKKASGKAKGKKETKGISLEAALAIKDAAKAIQEREDEDAQEERADKDGSGDILFNPKGTEDSEAPADQETGEQSEAEVDPPKTDDGGEGGS